VDIGCLRAIGRHRQDQVIKHVLDILSLSCFLKPGYIFI
jgi:hypothetical protein